MRRSATASRETATSFLTVSPPAEVDLLPSERVNRMSEAPSHRHEQPSRGTPSNVLASRRTPSRQLLFRCHLHCHFVGSFGLLSGFSEVLAPRSLKRENPQKWRG